MHIDCFAAYVFLNNCMKQTKNESNKTITSSPEQGCTDIEIIVRFRCLKNLAANTVSINLAAHTDTDMMMPG